MAAGERDITRICYTLNTRRTLGIEPDCKALMGISVKYPIGADRKCRLTKHPMVAGPAHGDLHSLEHLKRPPSLGKCTFRVWDLFILQHSGFEVEFGSRLRFC